MVLKEIILGIAIILCTVYLVLGVLAFRHVTDEERKSKGFILLIMDVWWPFYTKPYASAARKFCMLGRFLLPIIIGLYIWYFSTVIY